MFQNFSFAKENSYNPKNISDLNKSQRAKP